MFDIQVKPVPFLQPLSSLISVDLMIQEVPKYTVYVCTFIFQETPNFNTIIGRNIFQYINVYPYYIIERLLEIRRAYYNLDLVIRM